MHIKYAEYFLGIGAPGKAIKRVTSRHGDTCEFVYGFEIDKYARNAFCAIHNEDEDKIYHDITEQPDHLPYVDIVFYSPPCQTYSIAGKKEGSTVEKGNLFYAALQGIRKSKPKYAIMENVANLKNQFADDFNAMCRALDDAGYVNYAQVLNSKHYGIPQNRERIFIVSIRKDLYEQGQRFEFPKKIDLNLKLKDVLENKVEKKYYLSETMIKGFMKHNINHKEKGTGFIYEPRDVEGVASCLRANAALAPTDNTIKVGYINQDTQASQVYRETGLAPTIAAGTHGYANGYIEVVSANKKGFEVAREGDSINFEQPKSDTRRGRVGKGVAQTLTTSCNQGVLDFPCIVASRGRDKSNPSDRTTGNKNLEQRLEVNENGTSNALTSVQKDNYVLNKASIRKLIPLECFRLQGFDDEDYHKAVEAYDKKWKKGASDSQMYKRSGNSITVHVEEELIENLAYERKQEVQMTLF